MDPNLKNLNAPTDSNAQTGNKRLPMTPDAPERATEDPDPAPAASRLVVETPARAAARMPPRIS